MKNKDYSKMKKFLSFIWQLPQNCVGFVLARFFQCDVSFFNFGDIKINARVATAFNRSWIGVSLGDYIIIAGRRFATETTLRHERGHQIQSARLGWLYLPLIGLPSLCGNILHRFVKFDYYKQPWEKSADKLGGVKR